MQSDVTLPIRVVPATFQLLTRRCTQRQFLLTPDDEMNNAFLYCLIEAAQRHSIELILSQMMSNHHHTAYFDRYGSAVEFSQRFHSHLAKCANAYRGRWENVWASEEPSRVELPDTSTVMDKLVYTATNPVKDGLVEKVRHWPGPNLVRALLEGRTIRARRPWFLFRDDGPMPEFVEMRLTIPPELGDPELLLRELERRIAEVEEQCAVKRAQTNQPVLGRQRVRRQSWRDSPTSHEPRRGLRPRVAGRNVWARIAALQRNKQFLIDYRAARALWLDGKPAVFPAGTYWLRRFAKVTVAPVDPPPLPA